MRIAIVNGKGGSGKTTLSFLLAAALAEAGHAVGVEDTDEQRSASRWLAEAKCSELLVESNNSSRFGTVIVDTPPRLASERVTRAIRESSIILVVTSPSPGDLYTSRDTVEVLKREGCDRKARLVFNQVQTRTLLARELDELALRIGLPALSNRIHRRQCYQHLILGGWRMLPTEARDEIFKVALEVLALPRYDSMTVGS